MKISLTPIPTPPPITKITLELSREEWHDLQVIANIPAGVMEDALRLSTTLSPKTIAGISRTKNVYGLLKTLRESDANC